MENNTNQIWPRQPDADAEESAYITECDRTAAQPVMFCSQTTQSKQENGRILKWR
jgi:hypothetical protein